MHRLAPWLRMAMRLNGLEMPGRPHRARMRDGQPSRCGVSQATVRSAQHEPQARSCAPPALAGTPSSRWPLPAVAGLPLAPLAGHRHRADAFLRASLTPPSFLLSPPRPKPMLHTLLPLLALSHLAAAFLPGTSHRLLLSIRHSRRDCHVRCPLKLSRLQRRPHQAAQNRASRCPSAIPQPRPSLVSTRPTVSPFSDSLTRRRHLSLPQLLVRRSMVPLRTRAP